MNSRKKSKGRAGAARGTSNQAGAAAAGPGPGPGSSMRHCELCGCCVPGIDQSWQTHTTGIRHRRNVASQRVFGEAGHAVVSAFEHVDTPAPATYRGKDVVLLATQQRQQQTATAGAGSGSSIRRSRGRQGAAHDSADVLQQQLQRQLSKHLATQVGLGSIYNRAAERFSSDALAAAWQQLQSDITMQLQHRQQEWQQQQQQKQPAAVAVQPDAAGMQQLALQQAPQQLQQQQQQRGQKQAAELQLALSLTDAAQVACLAHVLPEHVTALALTVPYQSYGPAAAATCAAMTCFCSSMARHHSLRQLRLAFSSGEYHHILQQGGASLARLPELWGKALHALSGAMQVNCGLQRLVLASFPCQFPPEALAALQTSLATSRPRLRAALLAATHPRLGAASLLARLPHELLAALLERAVPRKGCSLQLELPQGLAGDSSSSSSDDDSSSDSSHHSSDSSDVDTSEDEDSSSSSSSSNSSGSEGGGHDGSSQE